MLSQGLVLARSRRLPYLLGSRLRSDRVVDEAVLSLRGRYRPVKEGLGVKETTVTEGGRAIRYLLCHNEARAAHDARVRAQIVAALEAEAAHPEELPSAEPAWVCSLPEGTEGRRSSTRPVEDPSGSAPRWKDCSHDERPQASSRGTGTRLPRPLACRARLPLDEEYPRNRTGLPPDPRAHYLPCPPLCAGLPTHTTSGEPDGRVLGVSPGTTKPDFFNWAQDRAGNRAQDQGTERGREKFFEKMWVGRTT